MAGYSPENKLDTFGKWDFIAKFFADPCDAPWTAYALSMFGAGLEMFVLFNQFDPSDVFWNAARRGSGIMRRKSNRKGQRGKKSTRFSLARGAKRVVAFDPNGTVGDFIGRWSPIAKKAVPGPVGFLWMIFNWAEAANFFFFLVDTVTQGLYRFASLLFNSRYCQAQRDLVLLKSAGDWIMAAIGGEIPIVANIVLKVRGLNPNVGAVISVPPGHRGIITAEFAVVALPNWPSFTVTVRMRKSSAPDPLDIDIQEFTNGGRRVMAVSTSVLRPGTYVITIEQDIGFSRVTGTNVYCQLSSQ